jgi:tetratricopeptide (TPR) repeat protein
LLAIQSLIARIHRRAGRMSDLLASLERARQFFASLVDEHPENRDYKLHLAAADSDLGDLHAAMGKSTEALASFEAALAIRRKMIDSDPSTPSYRSELADTLRRRGIAMRKCGRPADAVPDFRQSITVLRELTQPTAWDHYNMACAQSMISGAATESGSGVTTAEGRAAALEAMTALHRAVAAGWRDLRFIRTDTDLNPIRSQSDFQVLLMDMAFPADAFVRGK